MSTSSTNSSSLTVRTWNGSTHADWPRMIPAGRIEALDQLRAEGHQPAVWVAFRVQYPFESVADADHFPAQFGRRQGRAHDHGIHPGNEAGADVDGDASADTGTTCFSYLPSSSLSLG